MEELNSMTLKFSSLSQNESFARSVVAFFALQLNPSVAQLSDIKTAVSEAVTNAIVHGYPDKVGEITLEVAIENNYIYINIFDDGVGIDNVSKAMEPFFTTREDEERSGMGFTIMKTFMDDVKVKSSLNEGTIITMTKTIGNNL